MRVIIPKVHLIATAILLALVFSLGACNRNGSQGVRFASTSDPGVKNAPINNGPPTAPSGPVVSYADVVSRVSPAVITIHSEMRVRALMAGFSSYIAKPVEPAELTAVIVQQAGRVKFPAS